MFVARALKIGQIADSGMPPTDETISPSRLGTRFICRGQEGSIQALATEAW
jgi:hypothetical protein